MGSARTQARVILGSYTAAALPARPAGRVGRSRSPATPRTGDLSRDEGRLAAKQRCVRRTFSADAPLPRWHFLHTPFLSNHELMEKHAMKRTSRIGAGSVSALFAISVAHAQTTIDVSKISCDQLSLSKVASPDYIAIWLSGFYNGKRNNTIIDVEQLKDNAEKVRRYCLYNGKGTVMEAVEKVLSSNK